MLLRREDHPNHPPETWTVAKHGRKWCLFIAGHCADTFATKHEAERAKTRGFLFDLYHKERRWYAGESIPGWKDAEPQQPYPIALA